MDLQTIKIFLASSAELKADRDEFRSFIGMENDRLHTQGIYLEIVQWENFLDAISDTRLQNEYNKALRECHIALCLFFTKVGKYTAEEFDTAYQVFKDTGRPRIWTYFKDAPVDAGSITEEILTLLAFKEKIRQLGHFHSVYKNIDHLKYQFRNQLDKFLLEFSRPSPPDPDPGTDPESYVFNEALTRTVLEALPAYSSRAKKFLENATRMAGNWETQTKFSDPAKEIIAMSFVWVIGIQLRKLMAIGKEPMSEAKRRKYLDVSQLTCKRALQLVCFALISCLWDCKKETAYTLSPEQQVALQNFFDDEFELDINGLVNLLIGLVSIYQDNGLLFPIAELTGLLPHLQDGTAFRTACSGLTALGQLSGREAYTVERCSEAEQHLGVVLGAFNFLVNYKMTSIKTIGYFEARHTKPYYLYSFTALGIDTKSNINQERFNQSETPTTTDSVLLYKENNKGSINLFPFVIDVNALALEGGAKICFYTCHSNLGDSLNYQFLEDNSTVSIAHSGTMKTGADINEMWLDPQKRRNMRFDMVFNIFQEAKAAITGIDVLEEDGFQSPF